MNFNESLPLEFKFLILVNLELESKSILFFQKWILHNEIEHAKVIAPMSFTNSLCISLDFE
jgi:hypothetical protein